MFFSSIAVLAVLTQAPPTKIGDFVYYERRDPINDNLLVGLRAEKDEATLFIACSHARAKTIYVVLKTDRYLAPSSSILTEDLRPFYYRIDGGKSYNAFSEYPNIDRALVEGAAARAFTERLANGKSAFVRVRGVSGNIDVHYDIAGIKPLVERVAQKCEDKRLLKRLAQSD